MRMSHIELTAGAAQRLKVLMPSLAGLPGSVQSELFIIYSALKYLSMELARAGGASTAKQAAAGALRNSLAATLGAGANAAFHDPIADEPLSDKLVDVASLLELAAQLPAAAQDEVMEQLSQYLFDINQIDLNVYR